MGDGRICVIPAKGHSSRLPGKNALPLGGVPLVVRAVQTALAAELFDVVVVSTDDDALGRLSAAAGAEVPFRRDGALARDPIEVDTVVRHALQWYAEHRQQTFDWLCTLQPTSPLRTTEDVRSSWHLLEADPRADGVVSVSAYAHHPWWALAVDDGVIRPATPERATTSRSDLPVLHHPDGCIYWLRCANVLAARPTYAGRMLAYHTPPVSAVDIDEPQDLAYAEFLIQQRNDVSG